MRRVVVSEFVSLDGVMEDPGGAENFERGGWTMPYGGDDIWQFKRKELFDSDALLLGRVTYEGFAAVWPTVADEQGFADRMNGIPKYVVSRSLTDPRWNNSRVLNGDIATELAQLKQQPGANILVGGSATLVQALMRLELVDELRLLVYPVVLGSGKRLFDQGATTTLTLDEGRTFSSGVVGMVYRAPSRKR